MELQNPFPQRVRLLYLYVYSCSKCHRSDCALELHHIFGRKYGCAFNACVLCKDCHSKIGHAREERAELFFINIRFLLGEKYVPQHDDYALVISEPWLTTLDEWNRIFGNPHSSY